ncbi:hypothetical protein LIER_38047 [Lithospermum erythrorhizon]|uniref:DUF7769 domain-containing protein n=1 Tax=Lithospermum erythrorhizon TaxID=34254 RepID=A0AAV3PZ27_LITER
MDHHNFDLNDIPINVSNIDDDNDSSEGEYQIFKINLNEMYHEDDDNIDQHVDSEEEVGDDGGTGEDFHNAMTSGNFQTFENKKPYQMLNNEERKMVYELLLQRSINGNLKKEHTIEVSRLLKLPRRTVQRIWKIHKNTSLGVPVDVCHKKIYCGRKRVQIDINKVLDVPLRKRTSLRSFSAALGVQHSRIYRLLKEGLIRRHTNAIKPYLKEDNKRSWLQFCMSMIDRGNLHQGPKFVNMFNFVHRDEKWFYMTKKSEKYYLHQTEEEPIRTCQSKNYIGKVMFFVAMAHPRFEANGNEIFSGKIGVFFFCQNGASSTPK